MKLAVFSFFTDQLIAFFFRKLELLFCSSESAEDAANQLRMLRDGMLVEQGKLTEDVARVVSGGGKFY